MNGLTRQKKSLNGKMGLKMIRNIIKRLAKEEFDKCRAEYKEEIREYLKQCCRKMVVELFASNRDKERPNHLLSFGEVETIVGSLKEGIKYKVISELTAEERTRVMSYINGEEFIDSIIDRIKRKQL